MPQFVFLDTETDGVHIIQSQPFSYQISVGRHGATTYHDINKRQIKQLTQILSVPDTWLIGHNVKFDCHMLINAGVPIHLFKSIRIIDTMFMARLAIDHSEQVGDKYRQPVSLALKKLAQKYLGDDSRDEELILKEEFKKLRTTHKLSFKNFLVSHTGNIPNTTELNALYSMTEASALVSDFDTALIQDVFNWKKANPEPTYRDIPEYIMKPYATKDILLTKGLFFMFYESILFKQQQQVFVRESKIMYPLILMEREGLAIDKAEAMRLYKELYEYRKINSVVYAPVTLLKPGAVVLATYFDDSIVPTKTQRLIEDEHGLYNLYKKSDIIIQKGELMNLKSSTQMAALYRYETGDNTIVTANKQTRTEILDKSPTAKKLQSLRPLDKLIDTYLYRLINDTLLDADGNWKLYGTYNNMSDSYNREDDSSGTVTGRLSSDLQQFPKEPLMDANDNELVNIRKLFIVPKHKHSMWYFDMSQLELRLQTIWSAIIDGVPDMTMARGFVPYNCHEQFDEQGISKGWFLNEDPNEQWSPTDFHTIAAQTAFGHQPDYDQNKKHYRSLGKRSNFAISYGASKWKVMESLKVSETEAESLIEGFKTAYVGLTHMEKYLKKVTRSSAFQTNLFGRRYYTRDVHKLKNWLVQGSGGDLLKIFLARVVPFIEKYPHWKLMLTVHDEIDFVLDKEPTPEEVKEIMDLMFYTAGGIDVVAEPEYTLKSWGEQSVYDFK